MAMLRMVKNAHQKEEPVLGWKKDRSKEFMTLATPVMDALYGTAMKLTRNEEHAQDLVQDTYLKAFKYFETFERGTNFKAWMFRIMTRLFYDRYHEQKRNQAMFTAFDDVTLNATADPDTRSNAGERRLLAQELQKALDQLPSDFRLPLVLCDIQEFSYQEIADIMECPIGTVMSRLFRARKRMKEIILNMNQSEETGDSLSGQIIPF